MNTRAIPLLLICALLASVDARATPQTDGAATPAFCQKDCETAATPVLEPFLAPPVEPAPPSRALKATFWGGAAAGGVLLAVGAIFGVLSETHAAAANERFDARTLTAADRSHYDAARFDAKVANVSFATGALALVASAVSYLVDPRVAGDEAEGAGP